MVHEEEKILPIQEGLISSFLSVIEFHLTASSQKWDEILSLQQGAL